MNHINMSNTIHTRQLVVVTGDADLAQAGLSTPKDPPMFLGMKFHFHYFT